MWYINWFWFNTDQVRVLSRLTYFNRSNYPLLKLIFPDLFLQSFEILTLNLVDLLFSQFTLYRSSSSFRHTFTSVIAVCLNWVFRTFFVVLWIIQMNLYLHNTDLVLLLGFEHPSVLLSCFGPLLSVFVAVMPLSNLLGPVGDLYCLSNTFRMLVCLYMQYYSKWN